MWGEGERERGGGGRGGKEGGEKGEEEEEREARRRRRKGKEGEAQYPRASKEKQVSLQPPAVSISGSDLLEHLNDCPT